MRHETCLTPEKTSEHKITVWQSCWETQLLWSFRLFYFFVQETPWENSGHEAWPKTDMEKIQKAGKLSGRPQSNKATKLSKDHEWSHPAANKAGNDFLSWKTDENNLSRGSFPVFTKEGWGIKGKNDNNHPTNPIHPYPPHAVGMNQKFAAASSPRHHRQFRPRDIDIVEEWTLGNGKSAIHKLWSGISQEVGGTHFYASCKNDLLMPLISIGGFTKHERRAARHTEITIES